MSAIRSIVQNRLQPFAALYDPDGEQQFDSPSQHPGGKSYFRESTGSVHIVLSNKQYGDYRGHLLARHPYCHYCGRHVGKKTSNLDHVLPQSRGGGDWPANLVLTCLDCNGDKRNDTAPEWLDRINATIERQLVVRERLRDLLAAGELNDYRPTVPQGETVSTRNVPAGKDTSGKTFAATSGQLMPDYFKQGRRRFDIVCNRTRRRFIANMRSTDVASYLSAVGVDVLEDLRLVSVQNWHITEPAEEDDETDE